MSYFTRECFFVRSVLKCVSPRLRTSPPQKKMNEEIAYSAGLSTGFSAGVRSAKLHMPQHCRIYIHPKTRIPNHPPNEDDIYALEPWLLRRLILSPTYADSIHNATHLLATTSTWKRMKRLMHWVPPHRTFLIDFQPGCRSFPEAFRRIRLESDGCRSREGYDIIAPHTTVVRSTLYTTSSQQRPFLVNFWGHLSKPYIHPPESEVRYRLWKTMRNESDCDVGAYDVSGSVYKLSTPSPENVCRPCSYSCKQCYHNSDTVQWPDSPRLERREFLHKMKNSVFCLAVRGDNPGCPKLYEAILTGCIPVIVMDQSLPFESMVDYESFSLRFKVEEVLRNPRQVLQRLRSVTDSRVREYQRELMKVAPLFEFHERRWSVSAQDALFEAMCS